jgi:acetoin utilization deacetylase AcuC-like enzyme
MRTALITSRACLAHLTPSGHPESPARLAAVLDALAAPEFADLIRLEAPEASLEAIARVHTEAHIRHIERGVLMAGEGVVHLDPDTALSAGSWQAALRAAGAGLAAVDGLIAGIFDAAFCAVRPPGHHAEPNRAMGFCLFNAAAIAALHARAVHGLQRVAVVDFDVHHGNGSQTIAERDPDFFYGSIHEQGSYPNTGRASETGIASNLVNAPVPSGSGSAVWRAAFQTHVLAGLDRFGPEIIVVSAGFDAHRADPLAGLALDDADFHWATEQLLSLARKHTNGKLVSLLEGGYDLKALAQSAAAHVRALMGKVAVD